MTAKEIKVNLFKQAIENSTTAKRKEAGVEIKDGKIFYYITRYSSAGRAYKYKQTYREMLSMFWKEDIDKIMAL